MKFEIQEGTNQEELELETKEIIDTTENLEKDIEKLEITTLLSGKYDNNRLKIGSRCYIECTADGQTAMDMK